MTYLPGTDSRRRIYLMRHGHVDYLARHVASQGAVNVVPLTMRGRLQAEAAGAALAHVALDRAICSGFPRTHETASYVLAAQAKAPRLEIDEGLIEIQSAPMDPPPKSRAELIERMKHRFSQAGNPGAKAPPGSEEYRHAQSRAVAVVTRLLGEAGWHTALIVAHEGINRLLLSWACGAGLLAMGAFEQDTGCINVLDFDLDAAGAIARMMVKAVNLTPYNWLKHGMNLTSLEAIFERDATEELR